LQERSRRYRVASVR